MSDWQPIETAPKDGRWMLAVLDFEGDGELAVIKWTGNPRFPWKGHTEGSDAMAENVPLFWMEIPEPPFKSSWAKRRRC